MELGVRRSSRFWKSEKLGGVHEGELLEEEEEEMLLVSMCLAVVEVVVVVVGEERPRSLRALRTTEWRRASGPKARRIMSFSLCPCIRRSPMILEALSGSKLWILESTVLVAS